MNLTCSLARVGTITWFRKLLWLRGGDMQITRCAGQAPDPLVELHAPLQPTQPGPSAS